MVKSKGKEYINKLLLTKFLTDIISVVVYYKALPYLLNYPPGSINTEFQLSVNPTYYYVYYFGLFAIGIIIDIIIARRMLRPLNKLIENANTDDVLKIRSICFTYPRKILLTTTFKIPIFAVVGSFVLTGVNWYLTAKVGLLVVAFLGIPNIIAYFINTQIMKKILIETFSDEVYVNEKIEKTKITQRFITEIFSVIVISFISVLMFIICNLNDEIGGSNFNSTIDRLNSKLENVYSDEMTLEEFEKHIESVLDEEEWFLRYENGDYIGNVELSKFMSNYIDYYSLDNGGRAYDYYGENKQAAIKSFDIEGQQIVVGIIYKALPDYLFKRFVLAIVVFSIVDALIIYLSGESVKTELDEIGKRLSNIAKNDKIQLDYLPILSTSEIGSLTREINEVQDNINRLNEIMNLQTNFAAIGEVAALMAHDINNPASSIDISIDLLKQFDVGAEKQEQFYKLVDNMKVSNNKILKVVNDMNVVRNAVLTYKERNINGDVDIFVHEDNENCVIEIKDTAGGIPAELKDVIFNKILTTRGKKGTGLGLYLSANIVKGIFGGEITYETEENVGTTFIIKIPIIQGKEN